MEESNAASELGPFQLVVLFLSVFVLVVLAIDMVVEFDPEVARLVDLIDLCVCGVLLVDFGVRFKRAPSKLAFLKWGWVDLLASIPEVDVFRFGRVMRVFRVLRLIRALRSLRAFLTVVFKQRATGGLAMAVTAAFLALSLASLGVLVVERHAQGNIRTAEDALWWSLTTITTVGYGDCYPTTNAGRLIAATLMVVGVGLFGTLSGAVASVFLGGGSSPAQPSREDFAALRAEVATLRAALRPDDAARS